MTTHQVKAAATVTRHRLQPADADVTATVTTSSVCSGDADGRSQQAKTSTYYQPTAAECSVSQDEDMDDEAGAARRSAALSLRGTNKRSRTAEVHNLSERRRRDRINEKMRALQELIPNCNKVDKASMLEDAIEYLKTLQLQLQMMTTMSSMASTAAAAGIFMQVPPIAPFHHHLGMGLGFGVGAAAGFDVLPRLAGAHQFPFPVMPPMATMFGVPGQAMPSPSSFARIAGEQMDAAPAQGGAGAAGDHPPVPVAPQPQGDQNPNQT